MLNEDYRGIEIVSTEDLSADSSDFEVGYGFEAELLLKIGDNKISVVVRAGKANVDNTRGIKFFYKQGEVISQEFTSGVADDPVYHTVHGETSLVAKHEDGYNYYSKELFSSEFCSQTPVEQEQRLFVNELCIKLKDMREGSMDG
jgi:hypothetical protein